MIHLQILALGTFKTYTVMNGKTKKKQFVSFKWLHFLTLIEYLTELHRNYNFEIFFGSLLMSIL